jgi:hypothetical protein
MKNELIVKSSIAPRKLFIANCVRRSKAIGANIVIRIPKVRKLKDGADTGDRHRPKSRNITKFCLSILPVMEVLRG